MFRNEVSLELKRNGKPEPYPIQNGRGVYEFMRGLELESAEHMYELLFDTKHRIHGVYLVGKGGIDTCPIDPREVFKAALVTNSPAFLMVHAAAEQARCRAPTCGLGTNQRRQIQHGRFPSVDS